MNCYLATIGIIASVDFELKRVSEYLHLGPLEPFVPVIKGGCVFSLSGPGMVNAALSATLIAERFSPRVLVSIGIGGAYRNSGLRIGDLAIARREFYGDTGAGTPQDFKDMRILGLPLFKRAGLEIFNEIPVSERYVEKISEIAYKRGLNFRTGNFVTLSSVSGSPEQADIYEGRYSAICENMEGAAVGHVALVYGIEFIELRGISNIAGDRNKERWDIGLASGNSQEVLIELIEYLKKAMV